MYYVILPHVCNTHAQKYTGLVRHYRAALRVRKLPRYPNVSNQRRNNWRRGRDLSTVMATIAQMSAFEPENERISVYLERVQIFFVANGIEEDKQGPVFLSVLGGKVYALLRDLLAPAKPSDNSFDDLSDVLTKHFEPKLVVIAETFHFHRRSQATGESIAQYVADLRRLATDCKFGGYLSEALRDTLVCGLKSESTQKRLLAETDLTLAKAVEIAHSMEAADHNAQQLKGNDLKVAQVRRRHVQQSLLKLRIRKTLTTRGSLATVVEGEAMQRGSVVLRMYSVTTVEKR